MTLTWDELRDSLTGPVPGVLRWAGAVAKRLRGFNIALTGKTSGNANTDALTLADLTIQELLVGALRDLDPALRRCRIEAEESTGDLAAFDEQGPLSIALDPIDGTKQFRDRTGDGYGVLLHVRNREQVLYSLAYLPEMGPQGTWVQAFDDVVKCGPDDPRRPADDVLADIPPVSRTMRRESKRIYLIGFQQHDIARAADVTRAGLEGVPPDDMPGSIFPLMAAGEFAGSLIHTPNVYDFPISLHLARIVGGDAVWVHNRQPVHFGDTWVDDRADMVRLPGITACATDHATLRTLCDLARDWNRDRYPDG